jgi:hypothetical protein
MVQLIRITTDDNTGLFNNQFNDDLVIEKNSKVALHSMTCEISTELITIDAQNSEISFKLSGGNSAQTPYKVCNLSHGTYNASTVNALLADATIQMNSKILCTNSEVGRQWEVVENSAKKVAFNLRAGAYIQPTSTDPAIMALVGLKNVNASSPLSTKAFERSGGTVGNLDAFMWFKSPNCKGACSFSSRIYERTNNQGFIIAYLALPPTSTTVSINPANILYGIEFNGTASTGAGGAPYYNTISNGVFTATQTAPMVDATAGNVNSDYLSLDTGGGQIKGNIYRPNNVIVNLFTYDYDHFTDLFPVIIFKGDSSCKVNGIKFNSDPVYNVSPLTNFMTPVINAEDLALGIPYNGPSVNTVKELKFGDVDLALMLGFNQTTYLSTSSNEYTFTAEKVFSLRDIADSFVIELLNIPLNSYDGLTHQRRNILHTVVQTDMVRERLTYTAPYPLYIDMKNANKISLREVRARILREDLTAVNLTGFSQITLLISE